MLTPTTFTQTSAAQNEVTVRRLFDEFHNGGNEAVADEVLATPQLRRQLKRTNARLHALDAATHFTVDDLIAHDDKVVAQWTANLLLGNKRTEANGISIYKMRNGKVVELWQNWDELGALLQ